MCSDHRNLKNHPVSSSVLKDDRAYGQKQFHPFSFFVNLVSFLFVCLDVLIYRLVVTSAHSMNSSQEIWGFTPSILCCLRATRCSPDAPANGIRILRSWEGCWWVTSKSRFCVLCANTADARAPFLRGRALPQCRTKHLFFCRLQFSSMCQALVVCLAATHHRRGGCLSVRFYRCEV